MQHRYSTLIDAFNTADRRQVSAAAIGARSRIHCAHTISSTSSPFGFLFDSRSRAQRGYLPYDRVLEIYALFFHASVGEMSEDELGSRVEQFTHHGGPEGTLVVDYAKLVRERERA